MVILILLTRNDSSDSMEGDSKLWTLNMKQFKGTGIYIIREMVYPKTGLPSYGNTLGPTDIQVVKSVFQLVKEQDVFYEGSLLSDNTVVGLWDSFKMSMGINVQEKDKQQGENLFLFEYCGYSSFITPLDGFGRLLPDWFSTKHHIYAPTPYTFGRDPVPEVTLYQNSSSEFFVSGGGEGVPQAIAKYNSKTKELRNVKSESECSLIMRELTKVAGRI